MSSFASNALTATIPSGGSLSGRIRIGDNAVVAIVVSAAIDVTFLGSLDGVTFYDIYDGASVYTLAVTAGVLTTLDLNQFLAPLWIKVQSGTTGSPVTVGSDTSIIVVSKEI